MSPPLRRWATLTFFSGGTIHHWNVEWRSFAPYWTYRSTYDENNNQTTNEVRNENFSYDGLGNPLTIGNKYFYWHNVNQFAQIRDDSNFYEYLYNMDNQRVKKIVNGVDLRCKEKKFILKLKICLLLSYFRL